MTKPKKIGLSTGILEALDEQHIANEPRYYKMLARVLHEIADGTPDDDVRYKMPAIEGLLSGSLEWMEPIYGSPASELYGRLGDLAAFIEELRRHVQPIWHQEMQDDES